MDKELRGKTLYAFGDSIIYGHTAPQQSALRLITDRYGLKLSMFARNGATVLSGDNQIIQQLEMAPEQNPDFIVFDGYTNDAYGPPETDPFNRLGEHPDITARYGSIGAKRPDGTTFCGAFEKLLWKMKGKWPVSKIIFLTVHKSGARNFEIQQELYSLTTEMCTHRNVALADLFAVRELDTRDPLQMRDYIIDGAGSHPNLRCCKEFYVPRLLEALTET